MNKKIVYILMGIGILIVGAMFGLKDAQKENAMLADTTKAGVSSREETLPTSTTTITTSSVTKTEDNQRIMNATFHTNKGDFTIELSLNETPQTAGNFIKLAQAGFYEGVKFHRVIKGFMIQGGDPLTKDDALSSRWGTGGPGYTFPDELTPENRNEVGTISMANAGPDTNGSQFFINTKDNNFLDTKHTVFGKVISGMEVVRVIEDIPVGMADRPIEAVIIKNITLK